MSDLPEDPSDFDEDSELPPPDEDYPEDEIDNDSNEIGSPAADELDVNEFEEFDDFLEDSASLNEFNEFDDNSAEESSLEPTEDDISEDAEVLKTDSDEHFFLPVERPLVLADRTADVVSDSKLELNLVSLTDGFDLNVPPSLLEGPEVGSIENETKRASADQYVNPKLVSSIPPTMELDEGYVLALGKYAGDPFEQVQLRADRQKKTLTVRVESGDVAQFDLSTRTSVFEDTADSNSIILEYLKDIIVFKFPSADGLIEFMKNMPEEVFFASDNAGHDESDMNVAVITSEVPIKTPKIEKIKVESSLKIDRVKGTSVEDILESDVETSSERQEKIERMFQVKDSPAPVTIPVPRTELVQSHLRRPQHSVGRVVLLCEWINSLHLWNQLIFISNLHSHFCNGVLLIKLVRYLIPSCQFLHVSERPLVRASALQNLEQSLGAIWRSKRVNNSRVPSSEDIYSGNTSKLCVLLDELFCVYVAQPLRKEISGVLRWYDFILRQYSRPLSVSALENEDYSTIWGHFQSGTALFCVLFHFFGQTTLVRDSYTHRMDPLRIVGCPASICDFRDNLTYVFELLQLLQIDVVWTPEDWISNPDIDFIFLQLKLIYDALKFRQCTLPPAQGSRVGITSGANGEAVVVGLLFSDAPSTLRFIPKTQKAVRLGHSQDSMPLLSIDSFASNDRFTSHCQLPMGMLSDPKFKVNFLSLITNCSNSRTETRLWNMRTSSDAGQRCLKGDYLKSLLRNQVPPDSSKLVSKFGGEKSAQDNESHLANSNLGQYVDFKTASQDVASLVSALEKEMEIAKHKIDSAENDLANRYIHLEESINTFDLDSYEENLRVLEAERQILEQEKLNMQEYFERKLALIRTKKDEIQQQHLARQQDFLLSMASKERNSKLLRTESKRSVAKPRQIDTFSAEKGWISLSSKMNTHNFHLRAKQSASTNALQAILTPRSLRNKSTAPNERDTKYQGMESLSEGKSLDHSANIGSAEQVFDRFRIYLNDLSLRWSSSQKPTSSDPMMETAVSQKGSAQIAMPTRTENAVDVGYSGKLVSESLGDLTIPSYAREIELQMMHYEDERRRIVLSDDVFVKSVDRSKQFFANVEEYVKSAESAEYDFQERVREALATFVKYPPTLSDVEMSTSLLEEKRLVTVYDTNPSEFVISLASNEIDGYALCWQNSDGHDFDSGLLLLQDIESIEPRKLATSSAVVLLIKAKESSRAVRSTRGRALLPLGLGSEEETLNFCRSIACLKSIC